MLFPFYLAHPSDGTHGGNQEPEASSLWMRIVFLEESPLSPEVVAAAGQRKHKTGKNTCMLLIQINEGFKQYDVKVQRAINDTQSKYCHQRTHLCMTGYTPIQPVSENTTQLQTRPNQQVL